MTKALIKSCLRYPGGKQKIVKDIYSKIPSEFSEYREPFFGGGSVFFHVKQHKKEVQDWWINDKFEPIANFWQQAAKSSADLTDFVKSWKLQFSNGKELHAKLRREYATLTLAEQAAALFVLNRCSFSGLTFSGGYSQQAFDGRLTSNSIKNVTKIESLFSNTKITNLDYNELLTAPAEQSNGKVFIFLDPPYDIKSSNLYGSTGNMHQSFNHVEFADNCKNCKDHLWMITYNDNEHIRHLFSWANIQEIDVVYNMNSAGKKKKELVITNY